MNSPSEKESALVASGKAVVLQTALIHVKGTKYTDLVTVRVIFDSGANRSYCSESLARKLGLKVVQGPSITVDRFGSDEPIVLPTKVVKVQLQKLTVEIETSVIAKIFAIWFASQFH